MAWQFVEDASAGRVPHIDMSVSRSRGHLAAVRAPGHPQHVLRRTWEQVIDSKCIQNRIYYNKSSTAVGRTADSQSREPVFESSCCRFEAWAILFTPHCLNSLSCINEDLATDRGVHMNE